MCPIWPEVTPEKADLFNKYGRGIIHMGLHIGTKGFVYDRHQRKHRLKILKQVDVLDLKKNLKKIEDALNRRPEEMVSVEVKGQGFMTAKAFNGTGDDWQLQRFMIITADLGPTVMVDIKTRISIALGTAHYSFALYIDGVIDKTTEVRYQYGATGNAGAAEIRTVAYPGPGRHTYQLAAVVWSATTGQVNLANTVMRLTGMKKRGGE